MQPDDAEPDFQRTFALQVVHQLRAAGFEALWAGGCVRDALLGRTPDDYDVATSARPDDVIRLFGKRKTVPVGVSFGVVMVLGPSRQAGQVEVATFRSDGDYMDGRRPSAITFSSAQEDAKRRDLTINGMFYDPVAEEVIDYVGGRRDLSAGIIRAIGNAEARFTEDKLRMLRAIRFAATYEFQLDESTARAIRSLRREISQVSIERVAQELRRMLSHRTRAHSVQKLADVGLLEILFPRAFGGQAGGSRFPEPVDRYCRILDQLTEQRFEPALAVLLRSEYNPGTEPTKARISAVLDECRRLKLSREESQCIGWITDCVELLRTSADFPLHRKKPILSDDRVPLMLDVLRAMALADGEPPLVADELRDYLTKTPAEILDPAPLVGGADLKRLGVQPGPVFRQILTKIREEQLDEHLHHRAAAVKRIDELLNRHDR